MKQQSRTVSALVWVVPILWRLGLMAAEWLVMRWVKKAARGITAVFKSSDRLES